MNGRRWQYKVVQVNPKLFGARAAAVEAVLAPLGQQGWELVNAVQMGLFTWLYLKKEV